MKEGEPLQLRCFGNSEIFSTYPTSFTYNASNYHSVSSHTSPIDINKFRREDGIYLYNIYRPSTVYGDTGWYGCSYHPILTTITNSSYAEISLVYVYVEPEAVQFVVFANFTPIVTTVRDNVVIPCTTTSPTAEVRVAQFTGYGYDYKIPKYTFEPKFGITLSRIQAIEDEAYVCYMVPAQKVMYVVHLETELSTLPQPGIVNSTLQHVVKGDTLYMTCYAILTANRDYNDPFWIQNNQGDRLQISYTSESLQNELILYKTTFVLANMTYEDEGIYDCMVDTRYTWKKSRTYVQVHDSIEPFINLTFVDSNRSFEYYKGDTMEMVVQTDSYPSAEVVWSHPKGKDIGILSLIERNKYSIHIIFGKQTMKIKYLDLHDTGTYTVKASNVYNNKALKFTLFIKAAPKIYIHKRRKYYFRNQMDDIECHVEAYPRPNVTWAYRKCPDYPSCKDTTLEYLWDTRENASQIYLLSTVTTAIDMSGELICSACNDVGCEKVAETVSVSDELGEFGIVRTTDLVAEGEDWELICVASIRNFSYIFNWWHENGAIVQSGLATNNMTTTSNYFLEVKVPRAPVIYDTNLTNEDLIVDLFQGVEQIFHCFANGIPKPSVSWFKDGVQLVGIEDYYKFSNDSQIIEMLYLIDDHNGNYTCRAENRIGKVEVWQRITIIGSVYIKKRPVNMIISVVLFPAIFIIITICCALQIKRRKLVKTHILRFEERAAVDSLHVGSTVNDQVDLLQFHEKWEFPKERLKLGKELRSGKFGVVLKAKALSICEGEAVTTVAVKMVRRDYNRLHLSALASELKFMEDLGKHQNVVSLLGACTKNIWQHELLMILEYCRFGNLHNYLLNNRNGFINQIAPGTGKFDFRIGHDLLRKIAGLSNANRVESVESSFSDGNERNSESDSLQHQTTDIDSQGFNISADDSVLMLTHGDLKDSNLKPICTQDLLSWAFQVARGMEYLSQRRIVHCNLAARNILLADHNVAKICDFGLAKITSKEEIYKKGSNCPLPIKWLAIETMRERILSTQSDVWSFGIVLWEFFTLAETPYPGLQAEIVYQKLSKGYRMEKPEYATSEVYDIMCQCWKDEPSSRPSFAQLVDIVEKLLEGNVKAPYMDLNAPYQDMNRTRQEGGTNGYLTMVSVPDHVGFSPPADNYTNSSASGAASEFDYLRMKPKNAAVDVSHLASPKVGKEEEDPYLKPIDNRQRKAKIVKSYERC
ncbi:vascular endothelial growth factor receptor 1-like [Augochlora pura]